MEQIDFTPKGLSDKIEKTITVPFQRFEKYTSDFGVEHLYCFVEGHDDLPYYNVRVEAISGKQCSFVDSGGKKNVIALHEMLKGKKEYAKYKTLYFVDRDYDDNSNINNEIYITPGYSVENFYGSIDCFKKIIKGTYHIYEDNPKYNLCIELFNQLSTDFINATSCFCAWYRCAKKKPNHEIKLKESFPSNYASFENESITRFDYDLNVLNEAYPNVDDVTIDEFDESLGYIDNNISKIRGKYVMQFVEFVIKKLNNDSKTRKIYTDSIVEFGPNRKILIERLSAYADSPGCLRSYILENS